MLRNYDERLENLRNRRFNEILNESVVTKSFSATATKLGKATRYTLESMQSMERSYTMNTFKASDKVQANLERELEKLGYSVEFKHQGSTMMNTSIQFHSDIDLLVITKKFETLENPQTPQYPYRGNPLQDLKDLRKDSFSILNNIYKEVDNNNSKAIKVHPTNPNRKVDVVIANWFNSNLYNQLNSEIYRGINFLDRDNNKRVECYPFLHIDNVNDKGYRVNDGLHKLIRLLKNIKADTKTKIKLSSFEITSLLFGISDSSLRKSDRQQLLLLKEAQFQLDKLLRDSYYRDNLISPNQKEYVFKGNGKVDDLKKMKDEVDTLIIDIQAELYSNHGIGGFEKEIIYG